MGPRCVQHTQISRSIGRTELDNGCSSTVCWFGAVVPWKGISARFRALAKSQGHEWAMETDEAQIIRSTVYERSRPGSRRALSKILVSADMAQYVEPSQSCKSNSCSLSLPIQALQPNITIWIVSFLRQLILTSLDLALDIGKHIAKLKYARNEMDHNI